MILMDPDSRFQMYRHWSMLGHIDHNNRGTSLLELLTGEEPADSKSSAGEARGKNRPHRTGPLRERR